MTLEEEKSVTEYRASRMAGAPRRWTYWVAIFTLGNGLLVLAQQDLLFLAGFVVPFSFSGAAAHLITAAVLAALAFISSKARWVLLIPLVAYIADTALASYLGLWVGVALHAVVLVFVAITIVAGRNLRAQVPSGEERVA